MRRRGRIVGFWIWMGVFIHGEPMYILILRQCRYCLYVLFYLQGEGL